ncbi:MAG: MerR family transcriptional regulator [Candidatus Berkiella sp.]
MTQWYVKDLSKLTGVSVQTLHHYDRIALLKPSMRLINGYRLYSEKDLLKLQQIIALKFFGFDLLQIKNLLDEEVDMIEHFALQSQFLEEKAKSLQTACAALKEIIAENSEKRSLPWENIIQLIEVYRMAQQLEKTWAGKVFTPDELKSYANFEQELKTRFSDAQMKTFEQQWQDIIQEVTKQASQDPSSTIGISLGKRAMDWVNAYYGKKYAGIRNTIWEKGFKENQIEDEGAISGEVFTWLDQAISAYFRSRIMAVLSEVSSKPLEEGRQQWEALLSEMHGDDKKANIPVFEAIEKHEHIDQTAKAWLKQYVKAFG